MVIDYHLLGWNNWRITIPIFNHDGDFTFLKLAKDPEDKSQSPKMVTSQGAYAELYGWEHIIAKPSTVIICEGEFDRLVLESNQFRAVTSTGGAGNFRPEWAKEFEAIPNVYICFDRDEAGRRGALRVGWMIPHAKIVELPEEVGVGGDVTDYFARLRHTGDDFEKLLLEAKPVPPKPEPDDFGYEARPGTLDPELAERVERIKCSLPILKVVKQCVELRSSGNNFSGLCPFHPDHYPSLVIYPATDTFHCYGCQKHGDVITFIRDLGGLNFVQALDVLEGYIDQKDGPEDR